MFRTFWLYSVKWIFILCVAGAEPLPIITFPCKRFYFFFRFQFFSLSFPPALWDGLSNLSSTFLNDFSVVSVLCLALSKTVHLFHYYSLQFFFLSQPASSHISLYLRKLLSMLLIHLTLHFWWFSWIYFMENAKQMPSKDFFCCL